jgi:hypothetical protein
METSAEVKRIEIEKETLGHLNSARKWAMFIAIIGFIFLGLVTVLGVLAGTFLSAFNVGKADQTIPEVLVFSTVLLFVIICFFPGLFLLQFSKQINKAVKTLEKKELGKAFRNLKFFFVYQGVLIIIILSVYLATLIFSETSMEILKGL